MLTLVLSWVMTPNAFFVANPASKSCFLTSNVKFKPNEQITCVKKTLKPSKYNLKIYALNFCLAILELTFLFILEKSPKQRHAFF